MRSRWIPLVLVTLLASSCNKDIFDSATIRQLPKEEYLQKIKETPNAYILDVRTRMEYNKEHIEGAQSMSLIGSSFDEKIELLDTTRTVFLYCETAHRSPIATMKLKRVGFTKIYDLKNGYQTLRSEE